MGRVERYGSLFNPQELKGRRTRRADSNGIADRNRTNYWQTKIEGAGGTIDLWYERALRPRGLRLGFVPASQELIDKHNHRE